MPECQSRTVPSCANKTEFFLEKRKQRGHTVFGVKILQLSRNRLNIAKIPITRAKYYPCHAKKVNSKGPPMKNTTRKRKRQKETGGMQRQGH